LLFFHRVTSLGVTRCREHIINVFKRHRSIIGFCTHRCENCLWAFIVCRNTSINTVVYMCIIIKKTQKHNEILRTNQNKYPTNKIIEGNKETQIAGQRKPL